jgi:hypothetical protein
MVYVLCVQWSQNVEHWLDNYREMKTCLLFLCYFYSVDIGNIDKERKNFFQLSF